MWIKEIPNNFVDKLSYSEHTIFLWKSETAPLYIMDNHLSAAWCWMQECDKEETYNFMHIDHHEDLKGCGNTCIIDFLKRTPKISFKKYTELEYKNHYTFKSFQWDNYIRACHYLFPKWFDTKLFYTEEEDEDEYGENLWGYPCFKKKNMRKESVCEDIKFYIRDAQKNKESFIAKKIKDKKWIVNIDLDFFSYYGNEEDFNDSFIHNFAQNINQAMNNIQVITIAISPDCIYGNEMEEKWKNAIHILNIFKQEIKCMQDFNIKI